MNGGTSAPLKILGRYALHEAIASGGMATVHCGRLLGPVGFARTVAIKRLHERLAKDPEFTSMFLDEARLAARIRHPNVVPTLDVVALEDELFLVMEYIQGESLSRLYARERERQSKVTIPILSTLIAGALHGLHAAHEAKSEEGESLGLIHRDVSPQNILVGVDGVARVLDFGVAKAAGRTSTTRDGQLKGKLSYMAPEQLRGKNISRAIDIYAAGVVLWEGLVGRKLYRADTEGELVTLVLEANAEPPSTYAPEVSPELDAVVLKALAKDPSARWETARDMAKAIEKLLPPVPASDIGDWVESAASSALAARSQMISLIERSSTSNITAIAGSEHTPHVGIPAVPSSAPALPSSLTPSSASLPQGGEGSLTNTSALEIPIDGPKGRRLFVVGALAIFLLMGVTGTLLALSARSAGPGPTAASTPQTPTSSSAALALPSSRDAVEPTPTVTAEPPTAEPPKVSPEGPKPGAPSGTNKPATTKPTPGTVRTATPPVTTSKPTAPAPNCDPPYVIDENGNRRYKRECGR